MPDHDQPLSTPTPVQYCLCDVFWSKLCLITWILVKDINWIQMISNANSRDLNRPIHWGSITSVSLQFQCKTTSKRYFTLSFRLSTINRGRRPDDGGCVCRELPSLSFVVVTTHLLSHWLLPSNMKAFLKKLEGKKKEKTHLILDDTGHPWISFLWFWQDWGLYPAFLFWLGGVMRGCDPWSCDSWEEWGTGGRLPQAFSTVDMARREANLTFSQDLF